MSQISINIKKSETEIDLLSNIFNIAIANRIEIDKF